MPSPSKRIQEAKSVFSPLAQETTPQDWLQSRTKSVPAIRRKSVVSIADEPTTLLQTQSSTASSPFPSTPNARADSVAEKPGGSNTPAEVLLKEPPKPRKKLQRDEMANIVFAHFDKDRDKRWNYEEAREAVKITEGRLLSRRSYDRLCRAWGADASKGLEAEHVRKQYEEDPSSLEHDYKVISEDIEQASLADNATTPLSAKASSGSKDALPLMQTCLGAPDPIAAARAPSSWTSTTSSSTSTSSGTSHPVIPGITSALSMLITSAASTLEGHGGGPESRRAVADLLKLAAEAAMEETVPVEPASSQMGDVAPDATHFRRQHEGVCQTPASLPAAASEVASSAVTCRSASTTATSSSGSSASSGQRSTGSSPYPSSTTGIGTATSSASFHSLTTMDTAPECARRVQVPKDDGRLPSCESSFAPRTTTPHQSTQGTPLVSLVSPVSAPSLPLPCAQSTRPVEREAVLQDVQSAVSEASLLVLTPSTALQLPVSHGSSPVAPPCSAHTKPPSPTSSVVSHLQLSYAVRDSEDTSDDEVSLRTPLDHDEVSAAVVGDLAKLASFRDAGKIDAQQFATAKAGLLSILTRRLQSPTPPPPQLASPSPPRVQVLGIPPTESVWTSSAPPPPPPPPPAPQTETPSEVLLTPDEASSSVVSSTPLSSSFSSSSESASSCCVWKEPANQLTKAAAAWEDLAHVARAKLRELSPSPLLDDSLPGSPRPNYRDRLISIFHHYRPSKLPSVAPTLRMFVGFEEEVIQSLVQKYGPEPANIMSEPLVPGWSEVVTEGGDVYYRHISGAKQWHRPLLQSI